MLVLAQVFTAHPAVCPVPMKADNCCHCSGKMACCAERHSSNAPAKATVVQTVPHNQISFGPQLFSLLVPLSLQPASVSANAVVLKTAILPIYTRDCALLI